MGKGLHLKGMGQEGSRWRKIGGMVDDVPLEMVSTDFAMHVVTPFVLLDEYITIWTVFRVLKNPLLGLGIEGLQTNDVEVSNNLQNSE